MSMQYDRIAPRMTFVDFFSLPRDNENEYINDK